MNIKTWVKRILYGLFLLGTMMAVGLWIATITAKCEGFGCLGLVAIVIMALTAHLVSATLGGILIWLQRREGEAAKWLLIVEALNLLPVLWLAGRMALD